MDSLSRRAWLAGAPALALCAFVAVPGVIDPDDLDARPVNAIPALGVVLALGLTIAAGRAAGWASLPLARGDRARIAVAAVLVVVSLPWIAAELGMHFPQGVFLTTELYTEPHQAPTPAVHLGHHHGTSGLLLATGALLLSRPRLLLPTSASDLCGAPLLDALVRPRQHRERLLARAGREARLDRDRHPRRDTAGGEPDMGSRARRRPVCCTRSGSGVRTKAP